MNVYFSNSRLEKSLTTTEALVATYGKCASRVRQRYNELRAAPNLETFMQLPAPRFAHLEPYESGQCILIASTATSFELQLILPLPQLSDESYEYNQITEITIERIGKI